MMSKMSEINLIVEQAMTEDWYNNMTTSDLQGVVMAEAMQLWQTWNGRRGNVWEIGKLSDFILEEIYKRVEDEQWGVEDEHKSL